MSRPILTSEQQATAGPNPASLQRGEGPVSRESLDALLLLPHQFRDAAREIRDLKDAMLAAFSPDLYANAPALSDVQVTQLGSTSTGFLLAFVPQGGGLTELSNIAIGSDTAGKIQIFAATHDQLYSDQKGRLLGTVRVNSTEQTLSFPGRLILQPQEKLFLYHLAASNATLDFSADFRLLRGR